MYIYSSIALTDCLDHDFLSSYVNHLKSRLAKKIFWMIICIHSTASSLPQAPQKLSPSLFTVSVSPFLPLASLRSIHLNHSSSLCLPVVPIHISQEHSFAALIILCHIPFYQSTSFGRIHHQALFTIYYLNPHISSILSNLFSLPYSQHKATSCTDANYPIYPLPFLISNQSSRIGFIYTTVICARLCQDLHIASM